MRPVGSLWDHARQEMMGAGSTAVREEVERRGQVNRNNASDLVAGCGGEISQT